MNLFLRACFLSFLFFFVQISFAQIDVDFEVDITGDVCLDGVDNDLDGLTDYPNDPDCESSTGDSEGVYVPPPEPEPEPEAPSGGGSGVGFFERIQQFFDDEEESFGAEENPVEDEVAPLEKITETIEDILKPITFTFNIFDPKKQQDIVSEIPANDAFSERRIVPPVRFTLPVDTFEQGIKSQGESLVFQGPVLVTFFDIETNPVVVSVHERDVAPTALVVGLFALIGIAIAVRYTIFEFTEQGIKEKVYHPCQKGVIFSTSSIVFVVCIVILVRSLYQTGDVVLYENDTVSFETNITTNNKIEDQELLLEYRLDGVVIHKEFVTIEDGEGGIVVSLNSELYQTQDNSKLEVFVSRDAYNKFIGTYNIAYKKYSPRVIDTSILIVVIMTLVAELFELVYCERKTKDSLV